MLHDKLMALGKWSGCHQRPDRSLFVQGKQMPVCARCFGAFLGYLSALLTFWYIPMNVGIMAVLCVPMGIDWYIQHLGLYPSTNLRRVITGLLCGYGLNRLHIAIILKIVQQLLAWL